MELLPKIQLRSCQSCFILLYYFLLCMFLFSCKSSTMISSSTGNETDRLALLAFRGSMIEDPLNIMSSWNDSVHFCSWNGVSCSKRHPGRVTVLNLGSKKLAGTLPPHVGNLSFLMEINLTQNFFRGEVPREIGRLSRLRYLFLGNNIFHGEIPSSLSNCSNLQVISLDHNQLVGEITFELSYLPRENLRRFLVDTNNLTGSIPSWLGNATSLVILTLRANNFQGTIPSELGKLSNLKYLLLNINKLSGIVPPAIYNISSLQYLDIGDNHLHGRIPSDVGSTLFNLFGLYVGRNHFTGSLPLSLSNASRLVDLDFSANNFTGTVPLNLGSLKDLTRLILSDNYLENEEDEQFSFLTSLTNCSKFQILDMQSNRFRGELPSSIANFLDAFMVLSVGKNQISGTIPEGIEALVSLQAFMIQENMITGEIPSQIGELRRLGYIHMHKNKISGAIPASLGNITQLIQLSVHINDLERNIPPNLGDCRQLELLDLSRNQLTGSIPRSLAGLASITRSFNLAQNFLTGILPPEVGNMTRLLELDISGNRLSGEIPSSIGQCEMLVLLLLGDNSFEGSIPSTLSNLKSIKAIDLSKNNLSGQIPIYLQNFTLLKYLNLSYNNFEGEVPQEGIFRNRSDFSIVGNGKLCGGLRSLGLDACQVDVSKGKGVSLVLKISIPLAISCLIILVASFYLASRWRKRTRAKSSSEDLLDEHFPKLSYAELSKATNEFSSSNLLSRGSHGSVYKGILDTGGTTIAIKVLNLTQKGAARSFIAECNALRNIRHRNLLKIITACSSIDFKGADFKALVFEFMPNGSLEEWLHHQESSELTRGNLSLSQRLSIATGVASALEYLHHQCEIPVVHGDLKPSNILLDHEMIAHVGEFGLAKVLSNYWNENTLQGPMSSTGGLKGTVGYIAPEYGMGGMPSLQGDIYSFGIMLLEVFTGKRPTDNIFKNGMDLHHHVKMALPEHVANIVEPSILLNTQIDTNNSNTDTSEAEIVKTLECVAAILRIGVCCSMESPEERISMTDVLVEMNKIKDKYTTIRNRNTGNNFEFFSLYNFQNG